MKAKEKDLILSEIKADTFDYKKAIHGEIVSELEQSGYVDVTRTKDGRFFDLTDKGKAFLNSGGYSDIEKENRKQKYKEYAIRAIFFVLGSIAVKAIDILLPLLLT